MYTNPHNIFLSLQLLFERNSPQINKVIQAYEPTRSLTLIEGIRETLPIDAYPTLELEATSASNSWGTTRSQRPRFEFQCMLTVRVSNLRYGHEYITTLASVVSEIMTSPENLQLPVPNETHWTPFDGLVNTVILDSLVENVTYNSAKEGTIRVAEFSWFALIHEPYPETKWRVGESMTPSILRPVVRALP